MNVNNVISLFLIAAYLFSQWSKTINFKLTLLAKCHIKPAQAKNKHLFV